MRPSVDMDSKDAARRSQTGAGVLLCLMLAIAACDRENDAAPAGEVARQPAVLDVPAAYANLWPRFARVTRSFEPARAGMVIDIVPTAPGIRFGPGAHSNGERLLREQLRQLAPMLGELAELAPLDMGELPAPAPETPIGDWPSSWLMNWHRWLLADTARAYDDDDSEALLRGLIAAIDISAEQARQSEQLIRMQGQGTLRTTCTKLSAQARGKPHLFDAEARTRLIEALNQAPDTSDVHRARSILQRP